MQAKTLILSAALLCGFAASGQAAELKGNPAHGAVVFKKCMQCHHIGVGATNFYGPVLNGVVGRKAGTVHGYNYSSANKHSGIVWTKKALTVYLKQPQHDVPKTYMTFKGLKNPQDIADVIAYLSEFSSSGKRTPPHTMKKK